MNGSMIMKHTAPCMSPKGLASMLVSSPLGICAKHVPLGQQCTPPAPCWGGKPGADHITYAPLAVSLKQKQWVWQQGAIPQIGCMAISRIGLCTIFHTDRLNTCLNSCNVATNYDVY